jgi:hypothetical protein
MHPLLASALAPIQLYVSQRKQRKWRNYFKDEEYETIPQKIRAEFLNYQQDVINSDDLLEKLQYYKKNFHPPLNPDTSYRIIPCCM